MNMEVNILNRKTVSKIVARKTIGCYQRGDFTPDGKFNMKYIGRSTRCLQTRLLDHASKRESEAFKFLPLKSVREVYDMECLWFHTHRDQLENIRHPDAPRGLPYTCKYCNRHPSLAQMDAELSEVMLDDDRVPSLGCRFLTSFDFGIGFDDGSVNWSTMHLMQVLRSWVQIVTLDDDRIASLSQMMKRNMDQVSMNKVSTKAFHIMAFGGRMVTHQSRSIGRFGFVSHRRLPVWLERWKC